jgi:hypothetical protein
MYAALLLACAVALNEPAADLPPFVTKYTKTVTFYYKSPDPELGPKLLKELLKKENIEHPWFVGKDNVLMLNGAVFGDIAAGHPKIVRQYESAFVDAPLAGRRIILRALMNCGDPETTKHVAAWLADERYSDCRAALDELKKHLDNPKRQHVRDRPARTPDDLDLLWINFFVTGEYAPISRILDVLDLPDAKENEIMKRVTKWSVGSNLEQHAKLVELVQKHLKERPEASRKVLNELISSLPKSDGP